jgi:Erv1 / Alr family
MRTLKKQTRHNKTMKIKDHPYTRKDYQSNDGMLTSVWGPSMWHYLHTMSFNYPMEPTAADKTNYRNFVINLQYVLPCGKCRANLKKNFKKLPLTMKHMQNRNSFSRYIFRLHELVNTMLNKKSGLTYEEIRERYEHFRARCVKTPEEIKEIERAMIAKEEIGCTEPLYGEKSKCILRIVPQTKKCDTLKIDEKCIKRKIVL